MKDDVDTPPLSLYLSSPFLLRLLLLRYMSLVLRI